MILSIVHVSLPHSSANMFISIVNRAYMVVHANMQLSDSLKKSKKVNKDSKDDIDNQKPKKLKTKLKMTVILERLEDFVKSTGMVVVQSEELLPVRLGHLSSSQEFADPSDFRR